jgi:hypothetical protein
MGMFDYVEYEVDCPFCGEELSGFQSKDGECSLATIKPEDVQRFYTSCEHCGNWVEYEYIPPQDAQIVLVTNPTEE